MKLHTKLALRQKGWNSREITRAEEIIAHATQKNIGVSKVLFWSALILIVIANAAIIAVFIPFLLFFPSTILYGLIAFLGLMMGLVYNFLLNDMAHINTGHHILAFLLIPTLGVANIFAITFAVTHLYPTLESSYNSWILGVVFAGAFLVPYLIGRVRMMFRSRKALVE
ncbi:hypothetical protein HYV86_05455 [Candidatus Woesearchaeota archaeon]|nr:hypothetical protein [Candidatus Woesearchaeota archaeon]